VEIKTLIEIVVVLVGGIGSFFILKNTVENLKDENQKQWTVITDLREWQDTHQRNSSDTRLEIEKDMGKLRENTGKIEVNYLKWYV